ncbi:hypothetical protein GP486_005691 [Trichoglossum hirsutum]|uniref:Chloride channel protein n=1 Tax=Trichoglossum hirsutum TaxID=265104 RepID=A0A9P8L8S0_9PEZI|nr:hypothetical protein GP486_005691 [Trichoglossum hirsutum]
MSSSSSGPSRALHEEASSSRTALDRQPFVEDDSENEDAITRDRALLSADPLESDPGQRISFKRRAKQTSFLPKFLSNPLESIRRHSPSPAPTPSRRHLSRSQPPSVPPAEDEMLYTFDTPAENTAHLNGAKDGGPLDWYVEGPGRRVGYDDLTAIDWIFEYTKERQRLRVLQSNAKGLLGYAAQLVDASQIWLVLIATGIAAGVLAAGIDIASDWLGDLKTGYCKRGPEGGKFYLNREFCCWGLEALGVRSKGGRFVTEYIFFILYSILFAACASILVKNYAIYAKHSGIPEIKTVLGGFVIRRFMSSWTLVVKSLGLCLAVASGLWLGKEGPLVHVACCCANLFMKMFENLSGNEARKREVLSAAAAAGISVAFGSPLGGVLFSLEQLSYYFPDKTMWQSFVSAMVAAVTLQAMNPFRTGNLVLYQVTYSSGWHGFEIAPFALLGVIGGLYGGFFIKLNMRIAAWRKDSAIKDYPIWEVIVLALVTALINFPNVFMRAQPSELVASLFAECAAVKEDRLGLCKSGAATAGTIALLLLAAILGFILASATFGLQIPAGIILPSMAIGALYGRALGLVVQVWQANYPGALIFANCEPDVPCVTPGTYAIIGAASALGGVTRMTVSIVVIMFELTGALTYVLPIMIAVMVSKLVGDAMGKRGIYESWIRFKEYPFLDNSQEQPIPDVPASDVMTRIEDLVVITATGHTIDSLNGLLTTQPYRGFPVISDTREAVLLGYISRTELAFALSSALSPPRSLSPATETHFTHQPLADPHSILDLRPWMDQTPITLSAKSSLQLTVNMFQRLGLRYVLFCDMGVLQGLLTKKDVWYVLDGAEGVEGEGGIVIGREAVARREEDGEGRRLLGGGEVSGEQWGERGDDSDEER